MSTISRHHPPPPKMALLVCIVFVFVKALPLGSGLNFPFTEAPSSITYAELGSTVSLRWNYNHDSADTITISYMKGGVPQALVSKGNSGVVVNPNEPVNLTSRVTIKDNATFVIRNFTNSDSRTYICVFKPLVGAQVASDPVEIIVSKPPVATVSPSAQAVEENTLAKFTCTSDGAPDPDISWYRQINSFGEVQKIGNEGKITSAGKSSTLTIDPVDYKDAGMYLCKANNTAGEGNATGTLVVEYFRTDGPSQLVIQTTMKGTVLLPCPVMGFPQPRIKWRYPGGHIEDLFTSLLSITVQKRGDFGKYSCSARGKMFNFKLEEYKGPSPTATAQPSSSSCTAEKVAIGVIVGLAIIVIIILAVLLYKAKKAAKTHQQVPMQ